MMNAQQAEEFVRLVAGMQTSEENAAVSNCDLLGIFDDLIVTARKIVINVSQLGIGEPEPEPHGAPANPKQLDLMTAEWAAWRAIVRAWPAPCSPRSASPNPLKSGSRPASCTPPRGGYVDGRRPSPGGRARLSVLWPPAAGMFARQRHRLDLQPVRARKTAG